MTLVFCWEQQKKWSEMTEIIPTASNQLGLITFRMGPKNTHFWGHKIWPTFHSHFRWILLSDLSLTGRYLTVILRGTAQSCSTRKILPRRNLKTPFNSPFRASFCVRCLSVKQKSFKNEQKYIFSNMYFWVFFFLIFVKQNYYFCKKNGYKKISETESYMSPSR